MIDIHMHVIPDVDDGSDSIEESLCMLETAGNSGVSAVIATPHSSAFDFFPEKVHRQLERLRRAVEEKGIGIQLYQGAEILCHRSDMDPIVSLLKDGIYPTLNGTEYVLAEFFDHVSSKDLVYCLQRLRAGGWRPVIAHAERYRNLKPGELRALHEEGILIQINLYSVAEDLDSRIVERANFLLQNRLADFAGSDGHRMKHRPPAYRIGLEHLYREYDRDYVDRILQGNPQSLLNVRGKESRP